MGHLMVCHSIYPLLSEEGVVINVASFVGGLKQVSSELQKQFAEAVTEDAVTELMNNFVQSAQTGDHKKLGFSNSAYGMSKLGMI